MYYTTTFELMEKVILKHKVYSVEAEARYVMYFYVAVGWSLLSATVLILAFRHFKRVIDEMSVFIKLMVGLYEQEREKNTKDD